MRKELKEKIKQEQNKDKKQVLEIQAELLKLMLNSCYGFTLCNITSSKFKCFKNTRTIPTHKKRLSKLKTSIQLAPNVFLNEYLINIQDPFETVLGHVGSSILFNSKVILLKRLYFLLRFLNPTCAQLLYMDTDSAHFLLKEPNFVDNVDENIRHEFILNVDKHFESGPKISGVWVNEGFYTSAQYIGEKSYILRNSDQNTYLTHMKGLNRFFQKQFIEQNIDIKNVTGITYNIFYKSPDYTIFKSSMSLQRLIMQANE
jgi:DNA polymerase elongation subunit (family B)